MKTNLYIFNALMLIFFVLMYFYDDIEIDFDSLFLGGLLSNFIWLFIILGIGIFIYGKKIIDSFEKSK